MIGNGPAREAAGLVAGHYALHRDAFDAITRRARTRFERREWREAQDDARARLLLSRDSVVACVAEVQARLPSLALDERGWRDAKWAFRSLVADRPDSEVAETFFNSVTSRVRGTVGIDPRVAFVAADEPYDRRAGSEGLLRAVAPPTGTEITPAFLRELIGEPNWSSPWADRERDERLGADALAAALREQVGERPIEYAEMLRAPFYRNKGAYLVGRLRIAGRWLPLLLAIAHDAIGVRLDAVLATHDEAAVVFGFSRSYFHADIACPRAVVELLRSVMPGKRVDELYTALGFHRHGKTALYRSLVEHLAQPGARFELAEGDEGLVMSVFTLPTYNVVFKIIKDAFGQPKRTTRRQVREKYQLVFVHDRVGRLADAQEYEQLAFPRDRFAPALLARLQVECASTVAAADGMVTLSHLYTERRVTPLNVFLRHAGGDAAREAVLDFGRCLKELAGANIFTGDMLLKNFGITRHGRVICYDYDELALLTDCVFRRIPAPRDDADEFSAEPYFHVGEQDVFPEEFRAFLAPPGALREVFLAEHADLLDVDFWRGAQARVRAGEIPDVFPYGAHRRIPARR